MEDKEARLKKIKLLGTLCFSREEMQIILKDEKDIDSEEEMFEYGRLIGEVEIRKGLYAKARGGDLQAISQFEVYKAKAKHGKN